MSWKSVLIIIAVAVGLFLTYILWQFFSLPTTEIISQSIPWPPEAGSTYYAVHYDTGIFVRPFSGDDNDITPLSCSVSRNYMIIVATQDGKTYATRGWPFSVKWIYASDPCYGWVLYNSLSTVPVKEVAK